MSSKIEKLPVESIRANSKHRDLNEKTVAILTKSIAEIGLKTPISVRITDEGPIVIAGHHRLEAFKRLNRNTINCLIIDGDKNDAKLWAIAENLHRAELDSVQRADLIEAWKKLRDRKRDAQVARPAGGRQPHDKGVSATAKALGTSRDEVRRAGMIANIAPKAKAVARAAGLSNNKSALLKVAKEKTKKAQIKKVRALAEQKGKRDNGLNRTDRRKLDELVDLFDAAPELKRAWAKATTAVRTKFISQILKPLRKH